MLRPSETKKRVRRLVPSLRHGLLVVEIAEEGIYLRQHRRIKRFLLPHGVAYLKAVQLHVANERASRPRRRRRKR